MHGRLKRAVRTLPLGGGEDFVVARPLPAAESTLRAAGRRPPPGVLGLRMCPDLLGSRAAVLLGAALARAYRDDALRSVLGLPAPFPGAALQGLQPRLQVLHECGVGALVDALQLVGVVLQVVELYIPVVVLNVLVGIGPDSLESGFFGLALGFALALAFAGRFLFIVSIVFHGQLLQQDRRAPRG